MLRRRGRRSGRRLLGGGRYGQPRSLPVEGDSLVDLGTCDVVGWCGLTFPSVIVDDHLDDVLTHPIARLGDQGCVPEHRPEESHT
jgi:hypothetical protein